MKTTEYRELELRKVTTPCSPYKAKIKFVTPDGETNWLAIEPSELQKITAILVQ